MPKASKLLQARVGFLLQKELNIQKDSIIVSCLSNLVILFDFGEISHLDLVRSLKIAFFHLCIEIVIPFKSSISKTHLTLIKQNSYEPPISQLYSLADKSNFSSGPILQLTPHSDCQVLGNRVQILWIAYLNLSSSRVYDLRIFQKKMVFPFSKVVRQLVVGFFAHHILLDLVIAFDFLEDRIGIQIRNRDDHSILNSIEIKSPEVLFHLSHYFPLVSLEAQSNIGRLGSISLLHIFLEGQDSGLRVEPGFQYSKRSEIVFQVNFEHVMNLL